MISAFAVIVVIFEPFVKRNKNHMSTNSQIPTKQIFQLDKLFIVKPFSIPKSKRFLLVMQTMWVYLSVAGSCSVDITGWSQ